MRRRAWLVGLAVLLAVGACQKDEEQAGLITTNSPGKDEDPSLIRARDGSLWLAWFSERNGNSDIYITHSTDAGASWEPAVRVTTDPGGDFAPSLIQDSTGRFHLAWFRWTALNRGHIYYNTSTDGSTWNAAAEELVTTTDSVDDWVPTMTARADGTLLVYFVSALRNPNPGSDIYLSSKPKGGLWSAATFVNGLNSATLNDHLPFVAPVGTGFRMVWVRNDPSQLPWQSTQSDLWISTSNDGVAWTASQRITTDPPNTVNVFPEIYATQSGADAIVWLSAGPSETVVKETPLASALAYPLDVILYVGLPAGYSHRIAPTSVTGRYVAVWVQGPEGSQDLYFTIVNR